MATTRANISDTRDFSRLENGGKPPCPVRPSTHRRQCILLAPKRTWTGELTRMATTPIPHIPGNRLRQPVAESVAGRIPESPPRLVEIGQGVTHIARSDIAIARLDLARMRSAGCACLADGFEECVERGALVDGDIVDLIDGGRI